MAITQNKIITKPHENLPSPTLVISPSDHVSTSTTTSAISSISPTLVLPHRLSTHSRSHSRHTSAVFPLFHSSLTYTLVRDFAYAPFDPMHYGPVDDYDDSAASSPTDYDNRRISDPPPWDAAAGPWRDNNFDNGAQPLPSKSFGLNTESDDENERRPSRRSSRRVSKHRRSKSYTYSDDHARGRQRSSKSIRNSEIINAHFQQLSRSRNRSLSNPHTAGQYPHDEMKHSSTPAPDESLEHDNRGPGYDILAADAVHHPPFREDTELGPYSPTGEEHRPESASLDESFAGPSLALYDFKAENDNELELKEGQVIQVGYRHGQGWLVAMNLETGEQGLVPEEYVRLLRDIEGWSENDAEAEVYTRAEDQLRNSQIRQSKGGNWVS